MTPLYEEPCFTFRFADDRVVSRFHLQGLDCGRSISVFKIDPVTRGRLGLLATATVGAAGWVELEAPIRMGAGEAFIAEPA